MDLKIGDKVLMKKFDDLDSEVVDAMTKKDKLEYLEKFANKRLTISKINNFRGNYFYELEEDSNMDLTDLQKCLYEEIFGDIPNKVHTFSSKFFVDERVS